MQIVINIPEKTYEEVMNNLLSTEGKRELRKAVQHGTRLPKGRGRMIIISEDAVKREQVMPLSFSHQKWISEVGLSNATIAIIDTGSEEVL